MKTIESLEKEIVELKKTLSELRTMIGFLGSPPKVWDKVLKGLK